MNTQTLDNQLLVLDQDILEKLRADYGEKILAELIEDFKRIGRDSVDGFARAAEVDDQHSMTRFAHDLKSSAAALGLKWLSELSRKIELASHEGELDDARSLSPDLEPALAEAIRSLGKDISDV